MSQQALGVRFTVASTGTGDFVNSTTVTGYAATSTLVDGATYRYRAESLDLSQWEWGTGVWTAATSTLARTTIALSSSGSSKVSFTAQPQVAMVIFPADVLQFDIAMSLSTIQQDQARKNVGIFTGGGYANIVGQGNSGTGIVAITADAIALHDSSGHMFGATSVSVALTVGASGANGLDTGSIAANTGYYYFIIYNPTTGTVASLASLSATAPTMPSGYTYMRRIGWYFITTSLLSFFQKNNSFRYVAERSLISGASGLVSVSLSGFVPPTATRGFGALISNNNSVQVADDSGNPLVVVNVAPAAQCFWSWSSIFGTSITLEYSSSSSGGALNLVGWDDNI